MKNSKNGITLARFLLHKRRLKKTFTMRKIQHIIICFLCAASSVSMQANDTLRYALQQCRDLALTSSNAAKSQEETRLAAQYNRQAALAAMFPRVTANASYMWNSMDAHLLENTTDFTYGTATVNADGTTSWAWRDGWHGIISDAAGQALADGYKAIYDKLSLDLTHILVAHVGVTQPIWVGG